MRGRRSHRFGRHDRLREARERWEAASAMAFDVEAALTLYGGGSWEDAARALVAEHGIALPEARRWLEDNRREVGALLEAMRTCIRRPEDVARCWEEALRRHGLWNEKTAKRLPKRPKDGFDPEAKKKETD